MLQQIVLMDDGALLARMMPFIRCLNSFLLCRKGLLKQKTTVYRASRMTHAQFKMLQVGERYRMCMYVATSTKREVTRGLQEWQEQEMGEAGEGLRYSWQFTIPTGCRQATNIQKVSGYGNEHEVLLVPYSAILVTAITLDKASGMIEVSADVLEDSYDEPLDLQTTVA